MPPFIEIENVSFSYTLTRGPVGGPSGRTFQPALCGVSLKIEEGEYVAIIGSNGSGKTTLARLLNALLLPNEGQVRVAGVDTCDPAGQGRVRARVGMVFQYPEDQIVATIVEEDAAFGPENAGLPPAEIRKRVEDALRLVGLWELRRRPSYLLSAGQMQRVALAGVLALRPSCIIFDEATTMLDPAGRRAVLAAMQQLHQEGLTIITITHFMAEAALAERVVVLHDGRVALDAPPEKVFSDVQGLRALGLDLPPAERVASVLRHYLPGLPASLLTVPALVKALPVFSGTPRASHPFPREIQPNKDNNPAPLLEAEGLGHVYMAGTPLAQRALQGANFSAAGGSAHGLLGATGSGKSTLLQHLNGLLLPQEGRVRVGTHNLTDPKVDLKAVRRFAGLVMQMPETQLFEQYVVDEIAYGPQLAGVREALGADIRWAMAMVGLDFETYKDRMTFTLSGGERRKVALASLMVLRPPVLLLDEPTLGLDPSARRDLLEKLRGLLSGGQTLILSSHQMEDISELAEMVTLMQDGRDVLRGPVGEVYDQMERMKELGLEPSVTAQVAAALRTRGWPLPGGIIHPNGLSRAMGKINRGDGA